MTGHRLAVLALVVALAMFSAALVAAAGVAWGCVGAGALWLVAGVLLVDVEAMRR